ncbi:MULTISPECIES: C40 family peptidase [Kitasatospora]|uniref:C40 family peptidase n=1 Tax=Kitasatospora TaxID=2063 RepID=UPI000C700AAB|nr:NlpC/P60 family protein [Kitasatospora sp. GP30]MDH6138139.1 cell wall-associated NlpC family hydrolase [Kitasatospora sp. GP30]
MAAEQPAGRAGEPNTAAQGGPGACLATTVPAGAGVIGLGLGAATTPIGSGRLRRGDLIFWSGDGRASGIHHVAIYLGNNQYVEAPRPGKQVRISTLSSGYYPTHMGRP